MTQALEKNPALIQVSTAWGTRNGGPLGRNHYVEIQTAKPKGKSKTAVRPNEKKCSHATQAITVDGGARGQMLTVCAEPTCPVHHAESQRTKDAQEKSRAEQRKQTEARKQELIARNRIVAAILGKVPTPLKKTDLELVGATLLCYLPNEYRNAWMLERSRRDKQGQPKDVLQAATALFRNANEAELNRLLVEMSLAESVHNNYSSEGAGRLEKVAKRYSIDTAKIRKSVSAEVATKRTKREAGQRSGAKQGSGKVVSPKKR